MNVYFQPSDLAENLAENIRDMETKNIVALHNEYCEKINSPDDIVYDMEFLDEIMEQESPSGIIRQLDKDFNSDDKYFYFDGYAHLHSFSYEGDCSVIDIDEIADYIAENDDDLGDSNIRDFIDEFEENEDYDIGDDK